MSVVCRGEKAQVAVSGSLSNLLEGLGGTVRYKGVKDLGE